MRRKHTLYYGRTVVDECIADVGEALISSDMHLPTSGKAWEAGGSFTYSVNEPTAVDQRCYVPCLKCSLCTHDVVQDFQRATIFQNSTSDSQFLHANQAEIGKSLSCVLVKKVKSSRECKILVL